MDQITLWGTTEMISKEGSDLRAEIVSGEGPEIRSEEDFRNHYQALARAVRSGFPGTYHLEDHKDQGELQVAPSLLPAPALCFHTTFRQANQTHCERWKNVGTVGSLPWLTSLSCRVDGRLDRLATRCIVSHPMGGPDPCLLVSDGLHPLGRLVKTTGYPSRWRAYARYKVSCRGLRHMQGLEGRSTSFP